MHGTDEKCVQRFGYIIIKFVEMNRLWGCWLDLFGSRWETVRFCEYDNERLDCV